MKALMRTTILPRVSAIASRKTPAIIISFEPKKIDIPIILNTNPTPRYIFWHLIYFVKDNVIYLRLETRVVLGKLLAFNYVSFVFSGTNLIIICNCTLQMFKPAFKTGFSVHNNFFQFCGQVEKSQCFFC